MLLRRCEVKSGLLACPFVAKIGVSRDPRAYFLALNAYRAMSERRAVFRIGIPGGSSGMEARSFRRERRAFTVSIQAHITVNRHFSRVARGWETKQIRSRYLSPCKPRRIERSHRFCAELQRRGTPRSRATGSKDGGKGEHKIIFCFIE